MHAARTRMWIFFSNFSRTVANTPVVTVKQNVAWSVAKCEPLEDSEKGISNLYSQVVLRDALKPKLTNLKVTILNDVL